MSIFTPPLLILFVSLLSSLLYGFQSDDEYRFADCTPARQSKQTYFDAKAAPRLAITTYCNKQYCIDRIVSGKKTLYFAAADETLRILTHTRYRRNAYLYFRSDTQRKTHYWVIDAHGKLKKAPPMRQNALAVHIRADGNVVFLLSEGLKTPEGFLASPQPLIDAVIANDLDGRLAIIARSASGSFFLSDGKKWQSARYTLPVGSDATQALSAYPLRDGRIVYAVYAYYNSFNKGLLSGILDLQNGTDTYGWLINSQRRNVGFAPEIYVNDTDEVVVSALDTTNDKRVACIIPIQKYRTIALFSPTHIDTFFTLPATVSFLAGTSLQYVKWDARNNVRSDGGISPSLHYEISDSIFQSIYFQGKVANVQIALTYLREKIRDNEFIDSKLSTLFSALVDIDAFFSPTSTLRLEMRRGSFAARTTLRGEGKESVVGYDSATTTLDTYLRIRASVMMEKGFFAGIDYTRFSTPALLGLSKQGDVKLAIFDPHARIYTWSLLIGYDELSYVKRYETDTKGFFLEGYGGIGWSYIDFSDAARNEANRQTQALGYEDYSLFGAWTLQGKIEGGYIYQSKFKKFYGLGYSLKAGFRAQFIYAANGTSTKSNDETNDLFFEYERYDVLYGPYVSCNIVF